MWVQDSFLLNSLQKIHPKCFLEAAWLSLPTPPHAAVSGPHRGAQRSQLRDKPAAVSTCLSREAVLSKAKEWGGTEPQTGIQCISRGGREGARGVWRDSRRITSPREWGPIGDVSKRERNQTGYSSFNSTERNFTILTKFEQELVMSTQKPKQLKKMKQSLTSRLRRRWYMKGSVKIMAYHMAQLWIIFIKS